MDSVDLCPLSLKGRGRSPERGTVGTIHNHFDALEADRSLKAVHQVRHVSLNERLIDANPAYARACRASPHLSPPRLNGVLQRVVELVPAPSEELDPVVRHGVVAGRKHHTKIGIAGLGEKCDPWCRQDTQPYHVDTGTSQPGHHSRLQELTGSTWIAPNQRERRMPAELPSLCEYVGCRNGKTQR